MTSTTATPAQVFTPTLMTVFSENLHRGDVISAGPWNGNTVRDIKVGTKWVYITIAARRTPVEIQIGQEIPVVRDVETKESRAARDHASRNRFLSERYANKTPRSATTEALAAINDYMAKGWVIDSFKMEALIAGQASDKVLDELAENLKCAGTTLDDGTVVDEVGIVEEFKASLHKRLVQAAAYGMSRSTSVTSNIMDDAERQAIASFLQHWNY